MPDDSQKLTEMLEQVVAHEEKLSKLKPGTGVDAVLERLRKLRLDLTELLKTMKTQ